jgi:hypothetical protein
MTGFNTKKTMANDKLTMGDLKSNSMATTISHAENSITEVLQDIEAYGSVAQRELALDALDCLSKLYDSLRDDT